MPVQPDDLLVARLIRDEDDVETLVELLKEVFLGKLVIIKETTWKGKEKRHCCEKLDAENGVDYEFAHKAAEKTTAHYFGLNFETVAFPFYTSDDVFVEWYSPTCVRIVNTKKPRMKQAFHEVIITVDPEDVSFD